VKAGDAGWNKYQIPDTRLKILDDYSAVKVDTMIATESPGKKLA
jgi:hypothetical protein